MRPLLTQICHSPRLYVADGFASDEETRALVERGHDPAAVAARGIAVKHDGTGFSFELPVDGDAVAEAVRHRIHDALGFTNALGATLRYRHYRPGEAHPPHLDCYEIQGHHLVCTALLNLTDCAGGGETRFPRAYPHAIEVPARRGRLVCWFNYYPNGAPDESSFHEGGAVREGEKITVTAFIYRPLQDAAHRPLARQGSTGFR